MGRHCRSERTGWGLLGPEGAAQVAWDGRCRTGRLGSTRCDRVTGDSTGRPSSTQFDRGKHDA